MSKPVLVIVSGIGDIDGALSHQLYGYNDSHDAYEAAWMHETLKGLLLASYWHAYDGTNWVGVAITSDNKLRLDAAE